VPGHNHIATTTSLNRTATTNSNASDSFSLVPSSSECLRKIFYKVRPRKADVSKIKGCEYRFDKVAAATTITASSDDVSTSTTTDTTGRLLNGMELEITVA